VGVTIWADDDARCDHGKRGITVLRKTHPAPKSTISQMIIRFVRYSRKITPQRGQE
jgi:hypothetical protein